MKAARQQETTDSKCVKAARQQETTDRKYGKAARLKETVKWKRTCRKGGKDVGV